MASWNPSTHPYRIRKIRSGGFAGWSDSTQTFATRDEAEAVLAARMTGGVYEVQLDVAVMVDGKWDGWDRLATRKINQKTAYKG